MNGSARGPVSRVLSCKRYATDRSGHLPRKGSHSSGPRIAPQLEQPTRMPRCETHLSEDAAPLFGLAPGGVCRASDVATAPVRFYRTLSPLPVRSPSIGGILSVALSLDSRPAGVTRHPRFVEPGLSSLHVPGEITTTRLPSPLARLYLAIPRSRSKSSWNRIARTCPSISPSILPGRQRRWNASTALRPPVMS